MKLAMPGTVGSDCCASSLLLCTLAMLSGAGFAPAQPAANRQTASPRLPSVQEMIDSRTDVWGDAAMRQPNGASYEFFENLLPPLRWVNTDFRHYPIVLSAPRAPQKTRLVSNGSAINPRAEKPPMWYEQGVPVAFFVGEEAEPFGEELTRLKGPAYLDGFLPVVQLTYRQSGVSYRQEVFAPVDEQHAASGTSIVRFSLAGGKSASGQVEARIDAADTLRVENSAIRNEEGKCLVAFAGPWKWNTERKALVAKLVGDETAELAVYTKPADEQIAVTSAKYDEAKAACVKEWNGFLARGVTLVTPEQRVNDTWRAMLVGTYMLAVDDRLNYSAGNAYAKLYEGECGDVLRSVMLFGHLDDARRMLKPLLEFDRKATRFHVAGHKLQLLAYYYWITRDAKTVREYEPLWRPAVELILTSREKETGLLPKDNYAGDIAEQVYSLNSNANCWRGLRDVAAMLEDMGDKDEAEKLRSVAAEYRNVILNAVAKSERLDAKPPFIPIALLADEPAHDPLTATRTGSYYDLMCPYVIGSEIFGQGTKREDWLIGYLQQHGGISMGMIRTMPAQGQFKDQPGVNPLYGLRYQMALLRRDEREKALVGFYGQLAQGMTRGTFIGGEGSRFVHGDANGRSFYLPPNSASNAAWLVTLRNLLIQDWDLDEDARPETLRLLFAVPRAWLADGSVISVGKATTTFGPVSFDVKSSLGDGFVQVRVTPPPRPVKTMLLRAPLPDGRRVESVQIDGAKAQLMEGNAVDLSGRTKPVVVRFRVKRS
jgi:hypothetical protein